MKNNKWSFLASMVAKSSVLLAMGLSSSLVSAEGFLPEELGYSGRVEYILSDEVGEFTSITLMQRFENGPVFWTGRFDGTDLGKSCGTECAVFNSGLVEVSGDTVTLFNFYPQTPLVTYNFSFEDREDFPASIDELAQLTLSREGVPAFTLSRPFTPCDNLVCADGDSCTTQYGADIFGFATSDTFCFTPGPNPRGNNG